MKRFIVQYTIPYDREVSFAVNAPDAAHAAVAASGAFLDGRLQGAQARILHEDLVVQEGAGAKFSVVREVEEGEVLEPDYTANFVRGREMAMKAAQMLAKAYALGAQNGGSIEWSDLDDAHDVACEAMRLLGCSPKGSHTPDKESIS